MFIIPLNSKRWPKEPLTIFTDHGVSRTTLWKAVNSGLIRRIAPRIYTADLTSDAAEIVLANWAELCGHFLPGALIVDRSAAEGGILQDGILTVAANTNRKSIKLPGLEIRIRQGGPYESDPPWSHGLYMSSSARVLVDNLELSRSRSGRPSRTLPLSELEDWIASKWVAWGAERANRLRAEARDLAQETDRPEHIPTIDMLFDQLAGKKPLRRSAGQFFEAVIGGKAWDEGRLKLFDSAINALSQIDHLDVPRHLSESDPTGELPFFESYFSNYIEGTTFTVDEAMQIINTNTPPTNRPADGHDILGTYLCVADPIGRTATSVVPKELMGLLVTRHQQIMRGRPEVKPGQWKAKSNRAGSYEFVAPQLVEGTLIKGFERVADLQAGFARALYVLLVVCEVHPFEDGNGRAARVMMNAELSAIGAARIVIPNVYRNEYLAGLRRVSLTSGDVSAFIKIMTHAWRWTASVPWNDPAATEGTLISTNAFLDSTDAEISGKRLELGGG